MAILNTALIASSSKHEYAILMTRNNGMATIHHLNKDINKVDPAIHKLVQVTTNPLNSRHYFVKELEENKPAHDVSLVEIIPHNKEGVVKFQSQNFLQGFMDIHQAFLFHPSSAVRKVGEKSLPNVCTFDSLTKFVKSAFPADYENWKLVDPDLQLARQVLAVPTLN